MDQAVITEQEAELNPQLLHILRWKYPVLRDVALEIIKYQPGEDLQYEVAQIIEERDCEQENQAILTLAQAIVAALSQNSNK